MTGTGISCKKYDSVCCNISYFIKITITLDFTCQCMIEGENHSLVLHISHFLSHEVGEWTLLCVNWIKLGENYLY